MIYIKHPLCSYCDFLGKESLVMYGGKNNQLTVRLQRKALYKDTPEMRTPP